MKTKKTKLARMLAGAISCVLLFAVLAAAVGAHEIVDYRHGSINGEQTGVTIQHRHNNGSASSTAKCTSMTSHEIFATGWYDGINTNIEVDFHTISLAVTARNGGWNIVPLFDNTIKKPWGVNIPKSVSASAFRGAYTYPTDGGVYIYSLYRVTYWTINGSYVLPHSIVDWCNL